ncbi:MAG: erythromycin esterase family protein, partial [Gammaproteobacteria bacterium]
LPGAIADAAQAIDSLEAPALDALLERIGNARVVLLGEASHGSAEFYRLRAAITSALIARGGRRMVAVEADWPDAAQIDRFINGRAPAAEPRHPFARFPTWMWANREVEAFVRELRQWNAQHGPGDAAVSFHGLDLYSLYTSIRAVLAYLDDVDPAAARLARQRYACLEPFEAEPALYGAAARGSAHEACADAVVAMLEALLAQRLEYARADGARYFDATRNATLVSNAERYYRIMYEGARESWNLRDRHMFETLCALLDEGGPDARVVVWAHNSHLGDAGATEMGRWGETNLGELCRRAFGADCYSIGFGTHAGTVAAATAWDGPLEVKRVRPSLAGSYERLCHDSGVPRFVLPLAAERDSALGAALATERLERAIGVIYRPDSERVSHYFSASLPWQFDEWIWLDETTAVEPLPVERARAPLPATFPFGV